MKLNKKHLEDFDASFNSHCFSATAMFQTDDMKSNLAISVGTDAGAFPDENANTSMEISGEGNFADSFNAKATKNGVTFYVKGAAELDILIDALEFAASALKDFKASKIDLNMSEEA